MIAVFVESSALLAGILDEPRGEEALLKIGGAQRLSASRLLKVECERALIRLAIDDPETVPQLPEMQQDLKRLWSKVDFAEVTSDICDFAGSICPKSRLRTLDAIHLATFWRLKQIDSDLEMLSFDDRILSELR